MKFKVGEICEGCSVVGRWVGWVDVEIVGHYSPEQYPNFVNSLKLPGPFYVIAGGTFSSEEKLRKKFFPPKDQWDVAEDDFITWLNQRLLKGVIVGSIEIRGQPL
jgi:hypothetical protein